MINAPYVHVILKSAEFEHVEDTRMRAIVQETGDIVTKHSVSYLLYYICKISMLSSVFKRLLLRIYIS